MNHTRQYTIAHSDTCDQHQYSVIVRNATNTAQTYSVDNQCTPIQEPPNLSQVRHASHRETGSTIIEYGTWRYLIHTWELPSKYTIPTRGATSTPSLPMMTYAHAATEEYDTPSRIMSMAQKPKLSPTDRIQSHTRNQ